MSSLTANITNSELSDIILWETIERSRLNCNEDRLSKFIIGVYIGGLKGNQVDQFQLAIEQVINEFQLYYNPGKLKISVIYISAKDISTKRMSPADLIDQLLNCDVHFILSHIHQSILERNVGWTIEDLLINLERLKYHRGFPSGEQLACPVFTQDKYDYISQTDGYSIPTMKIPIVPYDQEDFEHHVTSWCSANCDGCGWVIKSPFTTNSHYVRFPKSIAEVLQICRETHHNRIVGFNQIPYLMIQPCVYNRKEYKMIFLNSDPFYISSVDSRNSKKSANGVNKAFSQSPHDELITFCKDSLKCFKSNCPHAITDGLFRVDVMQMRSGKFVVNEFESLEANYYGKLESQEFVVSLFLKNYWINKIRSIFNDSLKILSEQHFEETITLIGVGNLTMKVLS